MTTLAQVAAIQDPARRQHYVYWAYDSSDVLLYIGCSMNLRRRWSEHRSDQREWTKHAARFRLQGPYNYETARRLERAAIDSHEPPFNNDTFAVLSLKRQRHDLVDRLVNRYLAEGHGSSGAVRLAVHEAYRLIPEPVRYRPLVSA